MPVLSRERKLEVMARARACWAAGDVDGFLAFATPDFRFRTSYRETFPHGYEAVGKEACRRLFMQMQADIEPLSIELRRIVIDGERVAVWRSTRIRSRGAGAIKTVHVCDFATFREELVCEYDEYTDIQAVRQLADA